MLFVRDEGIVPAGKQRVKAAATLACGCWCVADVNTDDEGRTAVELLTRYGATMSFGIHGNDHVERCKTWLIDHGLDKENGWGPGGTFFDTIPAAYVSEPPPTDTDHELANAIRTLAAVIVAAGGEVRVAEKLLREDYDLERFADPQEDVVVWRARVVRDGIAGPCDEHPIAWRFPELQNGWENLTCPGCLGEGKHNWVRGVCKYASEERGL